MRSKYSASDTVEAAERPELVDGRLLRESMIPRADVVADVAAEGIALEMRTDVIGNGAALLDREVGDAAGRVEHPRLDKGGCRAGVEAAGTAPAAIHLEGQVRRKREIGEDRSR